MKPSPCPPSPAAPQAAGAGVARIVPSLARALLSLAEERGHAPSQLCRGLGFSYADLHRSEALLSYSQTRRLILRALRLLDDPALGLAVGARQSPVSWGLAGLAMLTCSTFGEAIGWGLAHQDDAGAMLDFGFEDQGARVHFQVTARVFDSAIEPFLVEEGLGGVLSVARHLVGPALQPLSVDLAYRRSGPLEPYKRFFRCPVHFDTGINRLSLDARWLERRLPGHDPVTAGLVRRQLDTLLPAPAGRHELVESLARRIRLDTEQRPRQADLALEVNLSERTLRRKLGQQALSYRQLRDAALYEKARDLLGRPGLTIHEVATAVGYADARAFRRAFKRWSGRLPTEFRRQA